MKLAHVQRSIRVAAACAGLLLTWFAWPADGSQDSPATIDSNDQPSASVHAAPTVIPAFRKASKVAILTVDGNVDRMTYYSLERRIAKAQRDGCDAIVIEINTFGGEMDWTLDICSMIKDRSVTPANVVAWVHPKAYSAGTYMALACREVVVSQNAVFGDAAPIVMFANLAETERAKAEEPLLGELIDSARRNHYDEKLVQGFVALGVELWLLEDSQSGERIFVDRGEYRTVFGEDPPTQLTPVAAPGGGPRRVRPWINSSVPGAQAKPGDSQQQLEYTQSLPSTRPTLTAADRGRWQLVAQVKSSDRLLTVRAGEAVHYGLAQAVIDTEPELLAFFGAQSSVRYDQTWSEYVVSFLMSFWVRAVLIAIFLVALFAEMIAPGMGVFGLTAVVALLLLIGAPWLAGLAQWWQLLAILLGLALIGVELFILPGMGFTGLLGVALLLCGFVGTFLTDSLQTQQGRDDLMTGLAGTLAGIFAAGVGMWLISRHIRSLPMFERLILRTELHGGEPHSGPGSTIEADRRVGLLESIAAPQRVLSPGDMGTAITDMRPAGRAEFHGRIVDVQSAGSFIDRGRPVRVVNVSRFMIEVEEAV
jgi:membrane-bound serine protease (ClpP class)